MSSLSAANADNYYHHPDYDPEKHGSRKKFHSSKGSSQWEISGKLRFEMMFNCWCNGCERIIGKGTRFNSTKEKVGQYYSTPIFEFKMKCPTCDETFVIQTDPKNDTYNMVSGLRKMAKDIVMEKERQRRKQEEERNEKTTPSAFERKEKQLLEKEKETLLTRLTKKNEKLHKDNYSMNRLLRSANRVQRKQEEKNLKQGKAIGLPYSLLSESKSDELEALERMKREKMNFVIEPPNEKGNIEKKRRRKMDDDEVVVVTVVKKRRKRRKKKL